MPVESDKKSIHFKDFDKILRETNMFPLKADSIEILQLNLGRLCNQSCLHCHVEAGPNRKEVMSKEILTAALNILKETDIPTVDITGGAPEMNPHFRWFVSECKKMNKHIMARCNLTIVFEPGQNDLPEFYKRHGVEIISSLPYYMESMVDRQRGKDVFRKSIEALRIFNSIGYGLEDSGPVLNLVYNPVGAFLPPKQSAIEADFRRQLEIRYGIKFNHLFTITNMPIGRFKNFLKNTNNYEPYMQRLISAYNPQAAACVMCKYTLSVGWDGALCDCDFNLTLGINCDHGAPEHIKDFNLEQLNNRRIVTGLHCYGCTAGAGSSCGGAVTE